MTSSSTPSPLVTSWVLVVPHPSPALNQVYSVAVVVAVVEASAVAAAAAVSVWASVAAVAAVAAVVVVALGLLLGFVLYRVSGADTSGAIHR